MPIWLLDLLLILTVYRATRFLVVDEFPPVRVPRETLIAWLDPGPVHLVKYPKIAWRGDKPRWGMLGGSIAYLVECPWCMSAWVGAGLVWASTAVTSIPMPVLVWAAASAVTGLLATIESHAEQIYEHRSKR